MRCNGLKYSLVIWKGRVTRKMSGVDLFRCVWKKRPIVGIENFRRRPSGNVSCSAMPLWTITTCISISMLGQDIFREVWYDRVCMQFLTSEFICTKSKNSVRERRCGRGRPRRAFPSQMQWRRPDRLYPTKATGWYPAYGEDHQSLIARRKEKKQRDRVNTGHSLSLHKIERRDIRRKD